MNASLIETVSDLHAVLRDSLMVPVVNEIPVLGQILSGGEGEGILAMTFTLSGPARDPSLSVNPLSLLAPGFLRNIFRPSGDAPSGGTFVDRVIPGQDK